MTNFVLMESQEETDPKKEKKTITWFDTFVDVTGTLGFWYETMWAIMALWAFRTVYLQTQALMVLAREMERQNEIEETLVRIEAIKYNITFGS